MRKEFWLITILGIIIVILTSVALIWNNDDSDFKNLSVEPGQEIESPLIMEGEARGAWFFEGDFPIKILDENENMLSSSYVSAQGEWMTEDFVAFKGQIGFISNATSKGFLVLQKDNPSGLPENDKEFRIPVILKPSGIMTVKVYFSNDKMDPDVSCDKVFYIEREIPKIEAVGSAVLWQLLRGPTEEEKISGFSTNINSGVRLLSLSIDENGVATADFDEKLEYQVGGSCRVTAIRSQITETLKQFETIKDVVISINERTEDILQP